MQFSLTSGSCGMPIVTVTPSFTVRCYLFSLLISLCLLLLLQLSVKKFFFTCVLFLLWYCECFWIFRLYYLCCCCVVTSQPLNMAAPHHCTGTVNILCNKFLSDIIGRDPHLTCIKIKCCLICDAINLCEICSVWDEI